MKLYIYMGRPCNVIANMQDCNIIVDEFEPHFWYYIHFSTNALEKVMNLLISLATG